MMPGANLLGGKNPDDQSFLACVLAQGVEHPYKVFTHLLSVQLRASTVATEHQAAGQHVVQRLLFLGERRHDISDESGDQVGEHLAEVPSRGTTEADALACHIGHHQAERLFPESGLPLRALHQSVVQPGQDQGACGRKEKEYDEHEDADIIHSFVKMEFVKEATKSQQKKQRDHYQEKAQPQDHVVDH
jgi:hypothetical protein